MVLSHSQIGGNGRIGDLKHKYKSPSGFTFGRTMCLGPPSLCLPLPYHAKMENIEVHKLGGSRGKMIVERTVLVEFLFYTYMSI